MSQLCLALGKVALLRVTVDMGSTCAGLKRICARRKLRSTTIRERTKRATPLPGANAAATDDHKHACVATDESASPR